MERGGDSKALLQQQGNRPALYLSLWSDLTNHTLDVYFNKLKMQCNRLQTDYIQYIMIISMYVLHTL